MTVLTAALYKFVELPDFAELQAPLLACCESHAVKGTLLLAPEGINGTIAGSPQGIYAVLAFLRCDPRLSTLDHKEAPTDKLPFYRMKVRLKREIVTLGVPDLHPALMAGRYVKPAHWNQLLQDPDIVLVDTRNDYEVSIGTFTGAVNPGTSSFSELPDWVEREMCEGGKLAMVDGRKPKVAMFCTGGIRCEKSTALLRSHGFDEVYHLEGGILKYLETVPVELSRWQGECFVFDERVAVGHGLSAGHYTLCRSCRDPLSDQDRASPLFELGVSCAHCHAATSEQQKQGYRERQRQVELADARQQAHIGVSQGAHSDVRSSDTS
ncbi:MAG: rhodanese-related sulfurtransferase [Polaromonas sp.]|uniref:oxygen-dependent tRNA uridine(34) hydroxylase TrhO n=1 Tax=Polaromonas sp. TaxID=1869339 RepID=UPI00180CC212|nr:rhodanese-related sulfurtransferase [Polaromonas sp.]NMM09842.1 rhodanese-related sulfurtransferase [Polaromonas sp.]